MKKKINKQQSAYKSGLSILIKQIDSSCDGHVSWDEFCTYMLLQVRYNEFCTYMLLQVCYNEFCTYMLLQVCFNFLVACNTTTSR